MRTGHAGAGRICWRTLFSLSRPEDDQEFVLPERIPFRLFEINHRYYSLPADQLQQEGYSRDMLARMFHTNRTTILQDFKKSTGQSINRYLTQLRMTMAAALLRDTS
jgi:AraC family L-rhamnose operon regulatory protein RhaS